MTFPPLEARVSALEYRQIHTEVRIEEVNEKMIASINHLSGDIKFLSDNMLASFRQLADYQIKTEQQIDTRFNQVGTRFDNVEARLGKVETRLDNVETRLDKVEARLDKIETRLDNVETRLDKVEARLGNIETLLTQILARLPEPKS